MSRVFNRVTMQQFQQSGFHNRNILLYVGRIFCNHAFRQVYNIQFFMQEFISRVGIILVYKSSVCIDAGMGKDGLHDRPWIWWNQSE